MSLTASKVRAQVTADTDEAERKMRGFGQTVSNTARGGASELGGLGKAFGALGPALGVASVGAAVATIGKAIISLEEMREESAQVEARFRAFAGGAEQADSALKAFDATLGNALTKDEKMAAASQLLGLGLANTAQDAATLTQQAMILGMDIGTLTQALETGRVTGLVRYGISISDVKKRAEELQRQTAGLSDTEATAKAIKEQLAEKSKLVADEGGHAATAIVELKNAWEDLKDAAADKVQLEVVVKGAANAVQGAADAISYEAPQSAAEVADHAQAMQLVADATAKVATAQGEYNLALESGREDYIKFTEAELKAAQAELDGATATFAHEEALRIAAHSAFTYAGSMLEVADALARAHEQQQRYDYGSASGAAWGLNVYRPTDQMRSAASTENAGNRAWYDGGAGGFYGAQRDADIEASREAGNEAQRRRTQNQQIARQGATDWQMEMRRATQAFENDFKNAMTQGINDSKSLLDLTPGGGKGANAPGANGAFEEIYRLQAFINDGTWAQTAVKHGLDKAGAMDVVKKFQMGQWDASVMQLVDTGKLTEQIQQAQLGQKMMDAVAADLAKASGADPKLAKRMLGLGGASDTQVGKIDLGGQLVPALTTAIDAELTAKGADLGKRGEAAWDLIEGGMLSKAGKSTRFVQMIDAMVDNALANYVPQNK